jgi:hypothetical protein
MEELAALIEIYKTVDAAFLIRDKLTHLEIQDLIKETNELRKDSKLKDAEEIEKNYAKLKEEDPTISQFMNY